MICRKSDPFSKEKVVSALKAGEVVILPTDTIYGFSASVNPALNTEKKIRELKGRDEKKPFIRLIARPDDIFLYSAEEIPVKILKKWPGALTIIVADKTNGFVPVAFRCPGDEWLRSVIKENGFPIYSTSANKSGFPPLNTQKELVAEFDREVPLIVLDKDIENPVASTIVRLEKGMIQVIRQGTIRID